MKDGNGPIAAYYLLAEELSVPAGGSVVESVHSKIEELESEIGELRAQILDFKSSDEGHVRAREMDEAQIKDLHAENKRLRKLVNKRLRKLVKRAYWAGVREDIKDLRGTGDVQNGLKKFMKANSLGEV